MSGGNPQIPKGGGDGPVGDYIAAMPGWKRSVGVHLDELIVRVVPEVHKAVKWCGWHWRRAAPAVGDCC